MAIKWNVKSIKGDEGEISHAFVQGRLLEEGRRRPC